MKFALIYLTKNSMILKEFIAVGSASFSQYLNKSLFIF